MTSIFSFKYILVVFFSCSSYHQELTKIWTIRTKESEVTLDGLVWAIMDFGNSGNGFFFVVQCSLLVIQPRKLMMRRKHHKKNYISNPVLFQEHEKTLEIAVQFIVLISIIRVLSHTRQQAR